MNTDKSKKIKKKSNEIRNKYQIIKIVILILGYKMLL